MPGKLKTDWSLLAKHLAGETSEKENAGVEKWLDYSAENRALFGQLKSDWKIMNTMNKQFNVDKAWNKVHGRITSQEATAMRPRNIWITPLRIAASLILIAVLGISYVYITGKSHNITITTALSDKQRKIMLPDETVVFLNAGTKLEYSKEFGKKNREITLSGEAYFEVTPDKKNPFLIHADQANIRVVGTAFNINTLEKSKEVEVYVTSGIVEVYQSGDNSRHVLLHPGYLGTVGAEGVKSEKSKNENSLAWKTGIMDFQETRLGEAIEVLNKIYHVNIICPDTELNNKQTDGTYNYPDESLDTILAVFCKQNYLKVEKSDNKIYLSK